MANKYMKVILQEDVDKLGDAGEIVEVKPGYGRNYLIPQQKAVMATEGAMKQLELMKEKAARRAELTVEKAKDLADRLERTSVTIPVPVGEDDKIHGTVTTQDIADALAERDIEVDRKKITIDQDISTLGEYTATVNLISELNPKVKVWVVKE
jgi:large subunit ribosomal protein L9